MVLEVLGMAELLRLETGDSEKCYTAATPIDFSGTDSFSVPLATFTRGKVLSLSL